MWYGRFLSVPLKSDDLLIGCNTTSSVQPLATLPSITKLYFTHSQHASGQSLTTWSIFALATLLWVFYGLLNRKPAIHAGNIIGLVMNLLMVNGILMHAGWTY